MRRRSMLPPKEQLEMLPKYSMSCPCRTFSVCTHHLSAAYAKSHGTVVVENLKIGNMVRASTGLARGILDAGWGLLVQQMRYKLAWQGGQVVEVPAAYSSQTCSACGHVDRESRRGEAFLCRVCGHRDHADLNAAKVLKSRWKPSAQPAEGSRRLRTPRRSRKASADASAMQSPSL